MAFLGLSLSLEPDWTHKEAAGKLIGAVFCWEVQVVMSSCQPSLKSSFWYQKGLLKSSLYIWNILIPQKVNLLIYLCIASSGCLLASDPATNFCNFFAVLDLATASTENSGFYISPHCCSDEHMQMSRSSLYHIMCNSSKFGDCDLGILPPDF